ncbi:hypothetical protein EDD16DRAFT_220381 [Pisolithus croceorrhizus]|nr:hypothetical protein EDD16DRAFT_220381 [Pisolithus croceorrhizus]
MRKASAMVPSATFQNSLAQLPGRFGFHIARTYPHSGSHKIAWFIVLFHTFSWSLQTTYHSLMPPSGTRLGIHLHAARFHSQSSLTSQSIRVCKQRASPLLPLLCCILPFPECSCNDILSHQRIFCSSLRSYIVITENIVRRKFLVEVYCRI